jgi:hypothetical protein
VLQAEPFQVAPVRMFLDQLTLLVAQLHHEIQALLKVYCSESMLLVIIKDFAKETFLNRDPHSERRGGVGEGEGLGTLSRKE